MRKIDQRKIHILKIVVEEYLKTGEVTGSKSLLKKHDLQVSSATVRNDMASLEKMGLIFQPYNSAWRLPTTRWLRVFVDYLMETMPNMFIEAEQKEEVRFRSEKIDDVLYTLVSRLTHITKEITFAVVPSLGASYYLGLSHLLGRAGNTVWDDIYAMIRMLEDKHGFIELLERLDITEKISLFIGDEAGIFDNWEMLTILVKKVQIDGYSGYIGILWPIKMDYSFNIAALKQVL